MNDAKVSPGSAASLIAYVDGASRGNPGPAAYGVVIQDSSGATIDTLSEKLGLATNNVAEYRALLAALEYALAHGTRRLKIYCDSELVARQMQGRYRVQSPDLKPLFERARQLAGRLEHFQIEHVLRHRNADADRLANEALDGAPKKVARPIASARRDEALTFIAVVESGRLRPVAPAPPLEEGAQYEVHITRRGAGD